MGQKIAGSCCLRHSFHVEGFDDDDDDVVVRQAGRGLMEEVHPAVDDQCAW